MPDENATPSSPADAGGRPRIAVVLAAGKGTRMRSDLPKVLHRAAGRPLLSWVVDAARAARCREVVVVVGHEAEAVKAAVAGPGVAFALQEEQRGTGHALAQAAPEVERVLRESGAREATVLVLSGDVPLVRAQTLNALAAAVEGDGEDTGAGEAGGEPPAWGALAAADLPEPGNLGRVLMDDHHTFRRIVEVRDASPEERSVTTVNAGLYAFPAPAVFQVLQRVRPDNAQGEIYLTDAPGLAVEDGQRIAVHVMEDPVEAFGVNTRSELARAHRALLDRHLEALMDAGVSVLEPSRTTVEPTVRVERDAVLHPAVALLGDTVVEEGAVLHQGVWVRDGRVGAGAELGPYAVVDGTEVATGEHVAPHARR